MMKLFFAIDEGLVVLTEASSCWRAELCLSGCHPYCVAVDPLQPQLVYCGTFGEGIWKSEDAGKHWRPAGMGVPHRRILSMAVSRAKRFSGPGIVYAGTEPSAVFRSDDGGETWRELSCLTDLSSSKKWSFPPRPETHHVRSIAIDPHDGQRLYVAIEAGALIRSFDGGRQWHDRTPDSPRDTHQLAVHESSLGRLYAAAGDGYFESCDGGDSWQQLHEGLKNSYVWSVAVDQGDPNIIIISSAVSPRHSHGEPAESFLYRRSAGKPWHQLLEGLPSPSGRRTAVLAAHPSKPKTFFAAWENGLFCSVDGGESWGRLETSELDDYRIVEHCPLVAVEVE